MKHLKSALAALALISLAIVSNAHEGHEAIVGEVMSISADAFELKTDSKTLMIKFSEKTVFEKDKKPLDKTHLRKGDRVAVTTSQLMSGELIATHVRLGLPAKKSKPSPKPNAV